MPNLIAFPITVTLSITLSITVTVTLFNNFLCHNKRCCQCICLDDE